MANNVGNSMQSLTLNISLRNRTASSDDLHLGIEKKEKTFSGSNILLSLSYHKL